MKIAVIVLNWNSFDFLDTCLASLQAQTAACDIWVVDNGSRDGSADFVQRHYPTVNWLPNDANLGYAGGNNAALRRVEADLFVLVNPDTVLDTHCVAALRDAMRGDDSIGITGCKVFYPDGLLQHAGGMIEGPQALPRYVGRLERDAGQYEEPREVDYVIGAAIGLRRTMLDEVGLLDEGFFLYFEEPDLCERARRGGWRTLMVPAAKLTHLESAQTVKDSAFYYRHFHASRWRYLLKHGAPQALLTATREAEREWLRRIGRVEQLAVAGAYRELLRQLPQLWRTRVEHGGDEVSAEQRHLLAALLSDLRALSLAYPSLRGSIGLRAEGGFESS